MKKVFKLRTIFFIGLYFLLLSSVTVCSMEKASDVPSPEESGENGVKIVKVDKVARAPEKFKGKIGIKGDVLKVYSGEKKFVMSCGDACVRLPVKYDGDIPKEKSKVIVYGEITTSEEGGYIFNADKIESK